MTETKCFFMEPSLVWVGPYADARAIEQMSHICVMRRITAEAGVRLQEGWSASRYLRADCVERRARRDIQRSSIRAAEREAAGPLRNLDDAQGLPFAVVDPDLATGDVHIAGSIRHNRRAATLGEDRAAEL